VAEWARVLAPAGAIVVADRVEKEQDSERFLTRVERAALPDMIRAVYKPYEVEKLLEKSGFKITNLSFYRLRLPFARIDAEMCGPAGVDPEGYRAIVERASPESRALYEVTGEGIVCRLLALVARRS
jgi:hypothetical protein